MSGDERGLKDAPDDQVRGTSDANDAALGPSSSPVVEIDPIVQSLFQVTDRFVVEEGALEFKIVYKREGGHSERAFEELIKRLRPLGYTAQMYGGEDDATLAVLRDASDQRENRSRVPVILFLLSLLSTFLMGYVVASIYPEIAPGSNPFEMGAGFEGALLSVLLAREFTKLYLGRRKGASSVSYFIPNLPIFIAAEPVLYFLPTFGSISLQRSPSINKNSLMDFYFLTSIVGIVVAVVVAFLGAGTSVVLTHQQYLAEFSTNQTSTIATNPSLLQNAVLSLSSGMGLSSGVPPGGALIFSPIEIAAWLGLLIAFFNLVPAALFDGGRMARLVLGERGSRATTLVSFILLLLTDLPNYSVLLLVIFGLGLFQVQGETLDSISRISNSRKALFGIAMVLAILCIPVPQNFATIPIVPSST